MDTYRVESWKLSEFRMEGYETLSTFICVAKNKLEAIEKFFIAFPNEEKEADIILYVAIE